MKLKVFATRLFSLAGLAMLASCTTFMGEYADPTEVEIIDDAWNETDARKTSEVLVNSMLKKPWLQIHLAQNKRKRPTVMVDEIINKTDEHIDARTMSESIRNDLINSGLVRFVNVVGRSKILDEISYQSQSGMVDPVKAQQAGRQLGAQFMLSGTITSQPHYQGNLKTISYKTILYLTNLETAELVWSEQYDIKKRFKNASTRW